MLTKPPIRTFVPYQARVPYRAARSVCWPTAPASSTSSGYVSGSGAIGGVTVCLPTYSGGMGDGPVNSDSRVCFEVR